MNDFIDVYSKNIMKNIAPTITTGISFRNNQFVIVRKQYEPKK